VEFGDKLGELLDTVSGAGMAAAQSTAAVLQLPSSARGCTAGLHALRMDGITGRRR
jgi:hypothetical protein